ncbi:MAG TPA: DUF5317 domain-containing protein [Chloroflexaceae bacterium]|nr:DUF5317 domain-containing protein [Chloroflexaceae bacterium]
MLRVLIVLAVIVAALLRGGSLRGFAALKVRAVPLVLGSLLIQLLIFPLAGDRPVVAALTVPLYLLSMLLLVAWVWLNRRLPGIVLIGAGVVMNLAAIAANGGYMPINPDAAAYAGALERYADSAVDNNSLASYDARLWMLTDIFPVPAGFPFATVYSLGDILLTTGVSILCYRTMTARLEPMITKGAQDEHSAAAA